MQTRLGILGSPESPYVRWLQQAAENSKQIQSVQILSFSDLAVELGGDRSDETQSCRALGGLRDVDAVMVRSMPLGSLEQVIFRMDCLQVLERSGVMVVNSPRCLEVAIDKWLTLHRLNQAGVRVPQTVACQTRDEALDAFERLNADVVVKPLFGGEGRGIVRVQDRDMAWRVFSTLQQLRSVLYVQQFLPHFGYDIRVLFVGEQHFSIKRHACSDSWRTNLSQGSRAEVHEITAEELEVAKRSAAAVGGGIVGVDLLPCQDGQLRVLEVNAVPGWKGLGQALQINVAEIVLNYVCELVEKRTHAESV